jgi:hypothetical protein
MSAVSDLHEDGSGEKEGKEEKEEENSNVTTNTENEQVAATATTSDTTEKVIYPNPANDKKYMAVKGKYLENFMILL